MELHKVYIWDSKYGIPTNDEEARTIAAKLANTFETEPNPRMVAFGKKMEEFVRPAWAYFGNVPELTAMYHVARDTANCLERIYCLGGLPDSYIDSIEIVACAAAENGLVVARELEYTVHLFLPDGTEYSKGEKRDWRNDAEETEKRWQETLAKAGKRTGKLPTGESARDAFLSLIIQKKIGKQLDLLCNQYHYTLTRMHYFNPFKHLQTELVDSFWFSADIDIETASEGYFTGLIIISFRKEYNDLIDRLMPAAQPSNTDEGAARQISLTDFYGVSEEENPKVQVGRRDVAAYHKWRISSREEAVVLAEAAADMLMYYLPHIGTAEDFTRFVQAHHAGETNFARLTLPDTNPNKRKFYLEQP